MSGSGKDASPNPKRPALAMALILLGSVWPVCRAASAPAGVAGASSPAYPLKLSANRRYLVDQNNTPFLITGDNPHALMGMASTADAESYFADRQANGFNAVWMNVLVTTPADYDSRDDASTPDGIRPFTAYIAGGTDAAHYDLTKPNQAYFARLDEMLTAAANHGLVVFLDPIDTCCKAAPARTVWLQALLANGLTAAGVYGKYLGERYKRFDNIIWLSGDDFNTWQTPENDAVVQAVAKAIKSADPMALQTVELNIFTSSSLDDQTWAPLISLNSTYTYSPTYIEMLHSYNQTPVMPTYLVEGHYDLEKVGEPTDYGNPWVLRRQGYWTMLSGGTGQLYGNAYTWPFIPGWKFYIDTVGVKQLVIWKVFFSSLPWQDLVPDQDHTVVTGGLGNFGNLRTRVSKSDFCTAAKTPDGSFVVAYMPSARTITVNMASLKGPASAKWFDPTNGAYTAIREGPFTNSGTRQFTPPGNNHDGDSDWVLVLSASNTDHER
jgi:Protein of unknown function (DUF4038)/Putative collagen-binding domain of a collagenase